MTTVPDDQPEDGPESTEQTPAWRIGTDGALLHRSGTRHASPSDAVRWQQDGGGAPLRVPVGVIGPREAGDAQLAVARRIGQGLGAMRLAVICGGRHGIMAAVAEGVKQAGGLSIGLLPDATPDPANPHLGIVIATGLGEARNAIIARAAFCLVAIGDSYGTLSEVALGRQFGKRVFGLEGAARVDGVEHLDDADAALDAVARHVLGLTGRPA